MGDVTALTDAECEYARTLAALFEKEADRLFSLRELEALAPDGQNATAMVRVMQHWGLVEFIYSESPNLPLAITGYRIKARAVEVVRLLENEESPDIVEQTEKAIRTHPKMGYVVVALIGLSFTMILVNQIITFLQNTHVLPK